MLLYQLSVSAVVGVATVEVELIVVVVVVLGLGVASALAGGARLHFKLVARWFPLQFLQAGLWWLQSWPLTLQSLQPTWSLE